MTAPAVMCRPTDTLDEVAHAMREFDLGALPVADEADALLGIVTDRDLLLAACEHGSSMSTISVASVCCTTRAAEAMHVVSPNDSLRRAESIMRRYRVRRLPVVNCRGRVLGVIALADLIQVAVRQRAHPGSAPNDCEVIETIAAICEPQLKRSAPVPDVPSEARLE